MSVLDREDLLMVIGEHGGTTPGLSPLDAGLGEGRVVLVNPTCGDRVELALTLQDGKAMLRGSAEGCTLARAAASLLAATVGSMAPAEAAALLDVLIRARASGRLLEPSALSGLRGRWAEGPGDHAGAASVPGSCAEALLALAELAVAPLRRRCILLPWTAAQTLLRARC